MDHQQYSTALPTFFQVLARCSNGRISRKIIGIEIRTQYLKICSMQFSADIYAWVASDRRDSDAKKDPICGGDFF